MSDCEEPVATVVNGHTFTIDTRYVLKDSRILGKGSFGVVCTAYDSVRKLNIAIKRIRPYANDEWDAKHTLREIRLLKLLGPHPNVVSLYELSLFEAKTELYMMMELMDCDLHRVIQSKQPLTEKHHKCFIRQILEAIKAMHAIGVFHRDLKPGNILVSKDCQVRITDFGLARFMDETTRSGQNDLNPMTEYVVTRWYRCPELLLSPNRPYSEAIDLWSIGCILAELLRRKPLFPGKSHAHQVQLVFEVMGYNNSADLGFPVSSEALSFLEKRCRYRKQPISKQVPEASPEAVMMLEALLAVNPNERPSAASALDYAFLADAEILNNYNVNYLTRPTAEFFDFEHEKYSVQQLKDMIDHEVHTASASAYRNPGSSHSTAKTMESYGSNEDHLIKNVHSTSGYNISYTPRDEVDGPVSQLTTQVRNVKVQHNPQQHHTIAHANNNTVYPARASNRDDGNSSNPFSKSNAQPSHEHIGEEVDPNLINKHNILTAVRNDMIGGTTANLKSGRKSAPKTPSPHKIDIILQKDNLNKQKALREQAEECNSLTARSDGTVDNTSSGSYYSNLFARKNAGGSSNSNGIAATNGSGKRLSSRIMSAFPSLPTGQRNNTTTSNYVGSKSHKVISTGHSNSNESLYNNNNSNMPPKASIAMMHSGSNVIYNEHDLYNKY